MKAKNFVALLLIAFLTSCVNQIDSEIEPIGNKVPITFAAKIAPVNTRVVDNAFEVGDKVGLYATIEGSSLLEERYIDNLLLSYGKSKKTQEKSLTTKSKSKVRKEDIKKKFMSAMDEYLENTQSYL